uniref:Reverse transcriptase zinc-binding domain-containing protein n=1 Tax=Arundo donax TaxID=35708 RepID=A0A0A9EUV3_ARUDO
MIHLEARKEANGGHCLLAWPKVIRSLELGGLGIHDLKTLCWSLRMRWLWLRKTQPDKPWASFPIQVHESVQALFAVAIISNVGDGSNTLFWTDNWLHGSSLATLAPHIFALVPKWTRNRRTV